MLDTRSQSEVSICCSHFVLLVTMDNRMSDIPAVWLDPKYGVTPYMRSLASDSIGTDLGIYHLIPISRNRGPN